MIRKPCILTVGSANMDMIMRMARIPEPGETMLDPGDVRFVPGGKGANCALALARLGANSVFCSALGNDSSGDELFSLYKREGIDCRFIRRDDKVSTGTAAIFLESSGANRIVVYPAANETLEDSQITTAFDCIPDALCVQFEIPFERVLHAAYTAYKNDIPIIVDAAPANKDLPLAKLPPLEIFSPNESETYIYTGIYPSGTESCMEAVLALEKVVTAKYYVIKMGSRGCMVYDGRVPHFYDSYRVHAVDTTAAGDAFTAALALAYFQTDKNIAAACTYANAVGACTVTKFGASQSLPYANEVEQFLKSYN